MYRVVPGANAPDTQSDFDRDILCRDARTDVMWPGVEVGNTWRYKCGSCGTEYRHKAKDDDAIYCGRCGDGLRKPDWGASKKLRDLLESALNGNGERMRDIGNRLAQNLLDAGEAYLIKSRDYAIDEPGKVSERPAELNEPERRTGTQGTLDYWVPGGRFVKTVNEWRHRFGLKRNVVFCAGHRYRAYADRDRCPECNAQMIDACGYVRTPALDGGGPAPGNGVRVKYFGEREVLGCGGWHRRIEAGSGDETGNYEHLGDYCQIGVDAVNSIRTLLNEEFFGPLAEGVAGRDTGFTLRIPLAVDMLQRVREK